jgi:tripartite-type tricarboxylate transporter receptor subunit TctC
LRLAHLRQRTAAGLSAAAVLATAVAVAACGDTGGGGGGGGGGGSGGGQAEFRRPLTLIVPFGPGSGTDQAARLVSPVLEKELGIQVPVVNVPGATGNTGMTKLLASRPNETAIAIAADTLATVAAGTSSFQLDEITPVCRLSFAPSFLWINTKGDLKSWDDVAAASKDAPVSVATVGKGGIDDIMLGALAEKGYKFRAVPFAENSERKGALLSRDVDVLYEQAGDVKENLESGQFKPVLMFGSEKSAVEGDYTLSSELGITEVIDQWRGLFAHGEMDQGLVQAMSDACGKSEASEAFVKFSKTAFENEGAFMPQQEFQKFVQDNLKQMQTLGKQYGVYE